MNHPVVLAIHPRCNGSSGGDMAIVIKTYKYR
jgi:hypothetical protein